jgi:hypothetical protein
MMINIDSRTHKEHFLCHTVEKAKHIQHHGQDSEVTTCRETPSILSQQTATGNQLLPSLAQWLIYLMVKLLELLSAASQRI